MIMLSVQNVYKAFGVSDVLNGASLVLQDGRRMGLVGVNGSGKSTLMKIIAGLESADSGQVTLARGAKIGYLAQQDMARGDQSVWETLESVFDGLHDIERRLRALEEEMAQCHEDEATFERLAQRYANLMDTFEESEGYAWRSSIQGVLAGLGFTRAQWEQKVDSLSGGERTRLCLARLLLQKPSVLLLDEPTNHLDLDALSWLEGYLQGYRGAVLVVSHDRYFLDAVCTDISELLFGQIEQYEGNYTRYQRLRAERFEARQRAYEQQRREIARQQAIIERLKSYNREKSLKRARSREKVLDKIELLDKPQDERQVRFAFTVRRRTGEDVLMLRDIAKGFDGRTLFENLNLHIRAGDRVALIGANGVGKSTLLKIIVQEETPDAGTVRYGANVDLGYYDQHQQRLHPDKTVLDELWDEFPQMEQSDLRSILGCFLFTGDDVFQPIRTLSGGERGRVALTRLMLEKNNVLLLDEPTNHLDMDSREALEEALEDFPGTLFFVSHDRYFINRLADHVVEMRPDGVTLYLGHYDDYMEKKRQESLGDTPEEPQKTRTAVEKEKKRDRQNRQAEKERKVRVAQLEKAIEDAERQVAEIEASLGLPEVYSDPMRAKEAAFSLRDAREALDALYEEWAALEE